MQEITRGIYYETDYPGVTLGALTLPNGTLLIDAPLRSEDARIWRNNLFSLGSSSRRMLVNLDSHTDRTLGTRAMECTIIAHQKTADLFRSRPSIFKGHNDETGAEWEMQNESVGTRWAIPDITFTHQLNIHWGSMEIRIEHHPGPTDGALWVLIPEHKVAFIGDCALASQPAFLANADIPVWLESIAVLEKELKNYIIISGRGGPLEMKEIKNQKNHLKNVQKGLERLANKNAPVDAVETLIPKLLTNFDFPASYSEQYTQRLRHGLYHYYTRHYQPTEQVDQI